jgi:hypothetical protein
VRISSRNVVAITASCRGFGTPLSFVFPSRAKRDTVSKNCSVRSAGRVSHRVLAGTSPAFLIECGVAAGTLRVSPLRSSRCSPSISACTVPSRRRFPRRSAGSAGSAPRRGFGSPRLSVPLDERLAGA